MIRTIGSVCSGIEAATVAWSDLGFKFEWFSEIANFPSRLLKEKYPDISNLGDMINIPDMISHQKISTPDLICGGTPCQAFSLSGRKLGLNDERGNLTLKFVDIIEANDMQRLKKKLHPTVVFWENVEGVLSDKTNAFGCLVSSLAGFEEVIDIKRWPKAGIIRGHKRNIAWRVLDAKFFGISQQRKRLYLLAGGEDFYPENVLFEKHKEKNCGIIKKKQQTLKFKKQGHSFEVFREYTDCLYSAYGTKWNGNAAAYNGSLYVVQNKRIRRFSPLECERLMGLPDNYTNIDGAKRTNRYQAIGNSWAIPVVKWIGKRLFNYSGDQLNINVADKFIDIGKNIVPVGNDCVINCSSIPENCIFSSVKDIVSTEAPEELYLTSVACNGILRRKNERNVIMNTRLEKVLIEIANTVSYPTNKFIGILHGKFNDN